MTFDDPAVRDIASRVHGLSEHLRRIELGEGPTAEELAHAPVLTDWRLGQRPEPALIGFATNHPSLGSRPVLTSPVYYIDVERGFARTLSRLYRLSRAAPKN